MGGGDRIVEHGKEQPAPGFSQLLVRVRCAVQGRLDGEIFRPQKEILQPPHGLLGRDPAVYRFDLEPQRLAVGPLEVQVAGDPRVLAAVPTTISQTVNPISAARAQ